MRLTDWLRLFVVDPERRWAGRTREQQLRLLAAGKTKRRSGAEDPVRRSSERLVHHETSPEST